jgi:hypothetical protein
MANMTEDLSNCARHNVTLEKPECFSLAAWLVLHSWFLSVEMAVFQMVKRNHVLPDREMITMVIADRPGHRSPQESSANFELAGQRNW